MKKKRCTICDAAFTPAVHCQKTCSVKCRLEAKRRYNREWLAKRLATVPGALERKRADWRHWYTKPENKRKKALQDKRWRSTPRGKAILQAWDKKRNAEPARKEARRRHMRAYYQRQQAQKNSTI